MSAIAQNPFPSPLRYPGGKGKLANYIKLLFHINELIGYDYVEPYAGGASVALSLLFEEYASTIYINDINRSVHAFWQAALNSPDELCKRIRDVNVGMAEWVRQKSVQAAQSPDPLDLAFSTLFLNRTNRSGILTAGVIGGKSQTGEWKLDARFTKDDLIARVQKIARFRSRIELSRMDAAQFLGQHMKALSKKAFLFLDPPYFVKGKGLYEHFYQDCDHEIIASIIQKETRPWIVSYDNAPAIENLYSGCQSLTYTLPYSAGLRLRGTELMFFSEMLTLPTIKAPANIPRSIVNRANLAWAAA